MATTTTNLHLKKPEMTDYVSPQDFNDDMDIIDQQIHGLISGNFAPAYSASATYAVGDYVTYNGQLYQCNTVIETAEAWTASHWTAVSVAGELSDLKSAIDDVDGEIYSSSEIVYNWANDMAPSFPYNFRTGYINTGTGAIGTNSTTLKKHVRNNKAVSFGTAMTVTITPPTGYYLRSVTEYSSATISADNFVRNLRSSTAVDESFTFENVPGKYYAIVVGEFTDSNDYYNQPLMQSIVATQLFEGSRLHEIENDLAAIATDVKGITVSQTNQAADYSTIKAAVEYAMAHSNTTIFVDSGEYDIIEELGGSAYTESRTSTSSYAGGLQLGNGTKIIGTGSDVKLTAKYTAATNQVMTDRFSIFNIVGSFWLENLEFEVQNVRYCVHEDMSALSSDQRPASYTGVYKNCRMKHNGTVSTTWTIPACIGGGVMNDSLHIIDGCVLISPQGINPAGYHNNATSNSGVAHVIVRDTYFANNGTMAFSVFNANTQVITAEVAGCRLGKPISDTSSGLYVITDWDNLVAGESDADESIALDYADLTFPVATGQFCWHDGKLYTAAVDIQSSEAWTAAHWQEAVLSDVLTARMSSAESDIAGIKGDIYSTETGYFPISLAWESGKFYLMSTGASSNYDSAKRSNPVPVTAGEVLKVTTKISTNIAGIMFFNSSTPGSTSYVGYDLYDLGGNTTRQYTSAEVTVPVGATYAVVQGRVVSGAVFGLDQIQTVDVSRVPALEEELARYESENDFEVKNLLRRVANAEKANPFAWAAFDKAYFVFIQDDTNQYLEDYAGVFHTKGVPMGAATIPANITETHLATLRQMVADGGEVLGHYNASPTEESSDATWMACTGGVKKALEAYGFEVHGLIKANETASSTNKGQKYCQMYYDYADNHLGKTTQYNLPRTLMNTHNYADLAAFKARIDQLAPVNGIHAFGFHGGREDEAWVTTEAFEEIINYINAKSNCEITTYKHLWDTFGSTTLLERIKALEA